MREKILLDEDWLFHKGDIETPLPTHKGAVYMQAKTERMKMGPACKDYRAVAEDYGGVNAYSSDVWRRVNLPHDYIIEQAPEPNENSGLGYFHYENAWYRKNFCIDESDKNKRITLLFDGIATYATVYLNGCLIKRNFCGYTGFEADISDFVKFGENNVLAVYVEANVPHEGWWYEGAGIYRHVWLIKTDTVSVDLWGVYAAPEKVSEDFWNVPVTVTVRNDRFEDASVKVKNTILNSRNEMVTEETTAVTVLGRDTACAKTVLCVEQPLLWDLDVPNLYTVKTQIFADNTETDCCETRFGFRTVTLDSQKGLFLNGKHVKIKGVCAHQDFGLTGKAVPDNVHRYKVELIKEMGANGYRTSHYPHAEAVMDALDELGFIVMDETRWFSSADECLEQLEMLVKRDRNRPSVMFWSIGNEEPYHITEQGKKICKAMKAVIQKLDNSRPVMTAISNSPDQATVLDDLDVIGINYNLNLLDEIHAKYPKKPILSSECCATGTTRGWYFDDFENKAFLSAYDKDTNRWFLARENTWKFMMEREWLLGAFQWIAFEHRGETIWPRLCSQSGAIDLFLQKKDAFYQNQSHWLNTPMVHLLPHWNWRGLEGEKINVWAYTSCDELALFLNDKPLERKRIEPHGHGEWQVPFEAGALEVIGFQNGEEVCRDRLQTSGAAKALKLRLDNAPPNANGQAVAVITCFCEDKNGIAVPDAAPFVSFSCNRFGKIVGTGSDITDHKPVAAVDRKMRAGRITVAVQVGKEAGELKVYARSEGLIGTVITVPLKK